MTAVRPEDLYEVLRRVRPLHQASARAVTRGLAGTGVTLGMRAVLEQLAYDGGRTVPQVARGLDLPRQVVQRVVDEARRRGYVELLANPRHRRSPLVRLTADGEAVFAAVHRSELERLGPAARALDARDVAACVRVLDLLVATASATASDQATKRRSGSPDDVPG